jgi:hypothetical protein
VAAAAATREAEATPVVEATREVEADTVVVRVSLSIIFPGGTSC